MLKLIYLFDILQLIKYNDAVNTQSIRLATEYQLKRARDQIESNYINVVDSGENYAGCSVFDMCQNPLTLHDNPSVQIQPWNTSGTAWHSPQCDINEVLVGVKPNNHDLDTGAALSANTCPEYNPDVNCDYDNSPTSAAIKITNGLDTNSQEFLDATCFADELENIWTSRQYSNCHNDSECNGTNTCLDHGVCSDSETPVGSFQAQYVEYQFFADQKTGVLAQIPATLWDPTNSGTCPGTYDPRFRPWYVYKLIFRGVSNLVSSVQFSSFASQIENASTSHNQNA